jgi:hypothetical protein
MQKHVHAARRAGGITRVEVSLILVILATLALCLVYFTRSRPAAAAGKTSRAVPVSRLADDGQRTGFEQDDEWDSEGEYDHERGQPAGPQAGAAPRDEMEPAVAQAPPVAVAAQPATNRAPATLPPSTAALLEEFKLALAAADPLAAFGRGRIQQMSGAEIQACLEAVKDLEPGPEAIQLLQEAVARWAALDPKAAADYAMALDSLRLRGSLMNSVIGAWAKTDLKAAVAYVDGIESQRTRSAVMNSLIGVWAATDPTGALAWLRDHANVDRGTLTSCTSTIFRNLTGKDFNQALTQAWDLTDRSMKRAAVQAVVEEMARTKNADVLMNLYKTMAPGADRTLLAETLVESVARYQPLKAVEWIATAITDPEEKNSAIARLIGTWSYDQPAQAAQWVMSQLADGELRRSQLARVIESWTYDNPSAAAEWLSKYPPSSQTDLAARSLAAGLARTNPEEAAVWAESITDENLRNRAIRDVAVQWLAKDAERAKTYIASAPLPESMKTRILQGGGRTGGGGRGWWR